MPSQQKTTPLSFDDIEAAGLLEPNFQLPAMIKGLSDDQRAELLSDLLTPVSRDHFMYHAQRELLQSFNQLAHNHHLRGYCRGLCALSVAAWRFVVKAGKPNSAKEIAARADGGINDMDALAIANLHMHWIELQRYAGLSQRSLQRPEFVSVRS